MLSCVTLYNLNDDAVLKAAGIYADLRKKGVTIGDLDILIASVVMVNDGTLITNNTKHYKNIAGLAFESWQ